MSEQMHLWSDGGMSEESPVLPYLIHQVPELIQISLFELAGGEEEIFQLRHPPLQHLHSRLGVRTLPSCAWRPPGLCARGLILRPYNGDHFVSLSPPNPSLQFRPSELMHIAQTAAARGLLRANRRNQLVPGLLSDEGSVHAVKDAVAEAEEDVQGEGDDIVL